MILRKCPTCEYEWRSETGARKGHTTICPKCGAEVPGDSKGGEGNV